MEMSKVDADAYEELEQLVFKYSVNRDDAMEAAQKVTPQRVLTIIENLVQKNAVRLANRQTPISIPAAFRNQTRKLKHIAKASERQMKDNAAWQAKVNQSLEDYESGFRPTTEAISEGLTALSVEEGPAADDVAAGRRFLRTLAQSS